MTKTTRRTHAKPVNLRIQEDVRMLDQALIKVDPESYRHYRDILDGLPGGEGFARLMNVPKPWQD